MLRAIREIQPGWIVGENVRGLTNWNGGVVFDEVQADLEAEGYEVLPFLLPAAGVNAPHRRDRIWFIAHATYSNATGKGGCKSKGQQDYPGVGAGFRDEFSGNGTAGINTNTIGFGQSGQGGTKHTSSSASKENWEASWTNYDGGWPTQSTICRGDDGVPDIMDRLTALGNAIVPQVAYQIFQAIEQYNLITIEEVNSRI